MASPMVESRIDPLKKAQYTLHISDQLADGEVGDYTSVHFNHKPAQLSSQRSTTISSSASKSPSANNYTLRIEDKKAADSRDVFIFTGQKTVPTNSYVLLFDTASQSATLESLGNAYTFNVATKNGIDMSSAYPKIFPRKQKDDVPRPPSREGGVDESGQDDVNIAADPENPYDFRHFLSSGKEGKNSDESEYNHGTSSPDYRTGTGSAVNTPQLPARKPGSATASASTQKAPATQKAPPKPRKRKSPEPEPPKKAAPLTKKPPPAVRLERRATTDPKNKSTAASNTKATKPTKAATKKGAAAAAAAAASSKIKSAELVNSSDDESDPDDMLQPDANTRSTTARAPSPPTASQRSPSPQPTHDNNTYNPSPSPARSSDADADYDEDEDDDDGPSGGALEIEIEDPDAEPSKPSSKPRQRNPPAAHRAYLHSPANGPISLASVASSVEGTPRGGRVRGYGSSARGGREQEDDDGVIDFDMGGDEEEDDGDAEHDEEDADGEADDVDVDPIDIGPPAARGQHQADEGPGAAGAAEEDDDGEMDMEDLLYKEVMEGLADGESSEESEEE